MPTDDHPNLDLIGMVQRARMTNDADVQPSQVNAVYWIEAKPKQPQPEQAAPTPRAGYWLIHTTLSEVDTLWARIKTATEKGQLGYKSKVATASRGQVDERLIHVMTYDAADTADVERVRAGLTHSGFTDDLTYQRS